MVSIETQKKIMYIPYINIINLFLYTMNCRHVHFSKELWIKAQLNFFGFAALPAAAIYLLVYLFPAFEQILFLLGGYLIPLVLSYGLIRFQEKYFTK